MIYLWGKVIFHVECCVDMLILKGSDHRLCGLRNLGAVLCVIKLKGWDNDNFFFLFTRAALLLV